MMYSLNCYIANLNLKNVLGKLLLAGLLCLLLLLHISVKAQQTYVGLPFINNYKPVDYQAGILNWQVAQDKRGLIYVANNFGVLEFDGSAWRLYPVPKGTKVRSICMDDGKIYVGSQGDFGYFAADERGSFVFHSLLESLPEQFRNVDEVWKVFIGNDKIYFCGFSNIYVYDGKNTRVIQSYRHLEPSFFVNNNLYLQSPGNPLSVLNKNHEIQPVEGGQFYADKLVTGIIPYSKYSYLVATKRSGIYELEGGISKHWRISLLEEWPNLTINCFIRLNNGRIVLGTQSEGVFLLDQFGKVLLHLNKGNGLASNTVLSIFQDMANNLWVGLNNGISHVDLASPITKIDDNLGVSGTGYAAMISDDQLYLGTNIGLFVSAKPSTDENSLAVQKFGLVENSEGQVYNLQKINSTLWMAHHKGAYAINGINATRISTTGAWIFKKNPVDPNKILLGTYSGISNIYDEGGVYRDRGRMDGFFESSRVMEIDQDQHLWMTHGYKGAYKISIDYEKDSIEEVKFYNHNNGFPSDILINVFKINNELLFTAERGIYKYDKSQDRFVLHPKYIQLLGENIHIRDMDEDPLGNIYFITNDQCGMIKKTGSGDLVVDYNTFNKIPKRLNDDLVNVNAIDMNNVIFSAKEGFIHYQPNKNETQFTVSTILIRRVECIADGDSLLYDGSMYQHNTDDQSVQLPYSKNDMRFTFASPFYEGGEEISYQYQLFNFDKDWSDWTEKTEKEYTNLPEGAYEFRVKARNIFGAESDVAVYSFMIEAPWYRSYTAYAGYVMLGLFVLIMGMLFVDRKHKKDKEEIKEKQKRELSDKEKELETMQEQKEAEITRLKNEKLNAELDHKNSELASASMHLLTKNALLGDIRSKLTNIKEEAVKGETKKGINNILKEIDASANLDKDWEQFVFHFDRVHSDFNKRIKAEFPQLTPQEMKLCAYLRLNFSTKEIAQLLHISVRGVEISRYRLRKKLGLNRDDNLAEFILHY